MKKLAIFLAIFSLTSAGVIIAQVIDPVDPVFSFQDATLIAEIASTTEQSGLTTSEALNVVYDQRNTKEVTHRLDEIIKLLGAINQKLTH